MSNHFHLLINIKNGGDLPNLMQFLLQGYSRYHKVQIDYLGYLWQGRYKSFLIEKESYLLECGRYIERNPIRAGLVEKAEDYRWSSYRHYALGENNVLVDNDPYYEGLSSGRQQKQDLYHDFVKIDNPYEKLVDHALIDHGF